MYEQHSVKSRGTERFAQHIQGDYFPGARVQARYIPSAKSTIPPKKQGKSKDTGKLKSDWECIMELLKGDVTYGLHDNN